MWLNSTKMSGKSWFSTSSMLHLKPIDCPVVCVQVIITARYNNHYNRGICCDIMWRSGSGSSTEKFICFFQLTIFHKYFRCWKSVNSSSTSWMLTFYNIPSPGSLLLIKISFFNINTPLTQIHLPIRTYTHMRNGTPDHVCAEWSP